MTAQGKKLVLAGGGTGGHIFPAIAIADAWEMDGGEVLFIGTADGMENRILPQRGKRLDLLQVGPIKGKGALTRLRTLLGLPMALFSAWTILRRYRPHVVLGMGGYVSAPTVMAARLMGIATALHEQNARAGLTNRLLGKVTDRVFVSFTETVATFQGTTKPLEGAGTGGGSRGGSRISRRNKPVQRVRCTGNPVRSSLFDRGQREEIGSGNRPFRLFVFGGSRGARIFSTLMPPTIKQIQESGMPVQVRHQVPPADLKQVRAAYKRLGITAITAPFFLSMAEAYREADLVICRSGATSIAELAILGKPALFIPYPFAADDHQTANAQAVVNLGGGWMQPQAFLSQAWLAEFLLARMADPEGLRATGRKARHLANPQAAQLILENLRTLAARA